MKKRKKLLLFLVLPILVAITAAAGFSREIRGTLQERLALEQDLDLFVDTISVIRSEYVDEVSPEKLFSGAMSGMLKSLDPYSQYLDKNAYRELKADTEGRFGGLGLEVSVKGGHLHVIAPLDGTPAEKAGVQAGDAILKLDGESTRDMSLSDAVRRMRGERGSEITLTILREGLPQLMEIVVVRDTIEIKSVKEAKLLDGKTGYIRLSSFQEKSAEDFEAAVNDLLSRGMTGLVVDVRNNAGGLLSAAVSVTEKFIPEGKTIVTTLGRNDARSAHFVSRNRKPYYIQPLVVLVNKGSASGSEIFASAIQDHGLGVVVGQKTFGKGSVQTLIPLGDGTAMRLTTSKYHTPAGRLIHEAGVVPDVIVENDAAALERAGMIAREGSRP